MRIATAQSFDAGIDRLQQRQSELAHAQQQLTSGKRVERASDDPSAAARAERALAAIGRADADQRAIEASRAAMALAEGTLGEAGELLQQAREVLVAAGNPTYGDAERRGFAERLRGLRGQLLSLANRGDGAGGWVFAGQGAAAPPFVDAPGGVAFAGVAGALQAASSDSLPISVDGRAAWLTAPSGNGVFETRAVPGSASAWIDSGQVVDPAAITGSTYSLQFSVAAGVTRYSVLRDGAPTAAVDVPFVSGQAIQFEGMSVNVTGNPADGDGFEIAPSAPTLSVFDVLDRAANALATPARTTAQVTQGNVAALRDLDASMLRVESIRAAAGETLNRIDSAANRTDDAKLAAQTQRTAAEDLDMVQAISDFQSRQTGYDAALRAYSMVQRLSLFDYLRG